MKLSRPISVVLATACGLLAGACGSDEPLLIGTGTEISGSLFTADGGIGSIASELDPDSEAAEMVQQYEAIHSSAQQRAEYFCECEFPGAEGDEWEACLRDQYIPDPPPVAECTRRVWARNLHAFEAVSCESETRNQYIECIEAAPSCLDFEAITECDVDRIIAQTACDNPPWDLIVEVQGQCWGVDLPPPFTCDNGTIINSEWQCDLEDDCGDRSDESGCANDPHAGLDDFN